MWRLSRKRLVLTRRRKVRLMARDYLQEASSVIFKDSVSLGTLLDTDPDGVVGNLLRVVATAQGMMGPTLRNAAAYALDKLASQDP
jgi:hypothetical protein